MGVVAARHEDKTWPKEGLMALEAAIVEQRAGAKKKGYKKKEDVRTLWIASRKGPGLFIPRN